MENTLWRQWNVLPWFITAMEKAWFYKRFLFEEVMAMVKDKRKYNKKIQFQLKLMLWII